MSKLAERPPVTGRAPGERTAATLDRVQAALPLASVYFWLCIVYAVEAWQRVTPWLFTDELELTQLSRSIAATGHAARSGEAHSPGTLYTVFTAPMWLIHDVAAAYATVKYLDVFAMASVVFPTCISCTGPTPTHRSHSRSNETRARTNTADPLACNPVLVPASSRC